MHAVSNGHGHSSKEFLRGDQKYLFIKELGSGTYGEVILAKNRY